MSYEMKYEFVLIFQLPGIEIREMICAETPEEAEGKAVRLITKYKEEKELLDFPVVAQLYQGIKEVSG